MPPLTMSGTDSGRSHFEMRQRLGSGSFGEVYLSTMVSSGGIRQEVAVKILAQDLDPRSQPVARLRDEGRILGSLNHPVILQVRDLVVLGGRIGLVMEYVPGADLSDLIERSGKLPPRVALQVAGHVAEALDAAFSSPGPDGEPLALVHRDIKPANVRVTPHGTVKLLDFGIAKMQSPDRETSTQHLVLIGSLPYMAPEVLHMDVDEAQMPRDVFALGCCLYESLTGRRFYGDLKRKELRAQTAREERYREWMAERFAELPDEVPADLVMLLSSMLAFDPKRRPSAHEAAESAFELAEQAGGATLRAWARSSQWRTDLGDVGAWTGKQVTESTISSGGSSYPSPSLDPEELADLAARRAAAGSLPPGGHGSRSAAVPVVAAVLGAMLIGLAGGLFAVDRTNKKAAAVAAQQAAELAVVAGAMAEQPSADTSSVDDAPALGPTPAAQPEIALEAVVDDVAERIVLRDAAPSKPLTVVPEPQRARPSDVAPQRRGVVRPMVADRAEKGSAQPPEIPATISLRSQGSVQMELRKDGVRHQGGEVSPGVWEVYADFGAGMAKQVMVVAPPLAVITVRCDASIQVCSVVD